MTAPRIGLVLGGGGLTGTAFHAGLVAGLAEFADWDARRAEVIVGHLSGIHLRCAVARRAAPGRLRRAHGRSAHVRRGRAGARRPRPLAPTASPRTSTPPPGGPGLLPSIARRPWRYRPGIAAAALLPEGNLAVDAGVSWIGDLFEEWPEQPTWICTVRLDDGVRVVFGRDADASVRDAVTASCAIPGYFTPVVIDGHRHVDGGMWSIHNLDLVAGLGLDLVVVSAPMSTADPLAAERGTLLRMPVRRRLDREAEQVRRSGTPVIVVQPDARLREVMGTSTMRLSRRAPVAQATHTYVRELARAGRLDDLVSAARRG